MGRLPQWVELVRVFYRLTAVILLLVALATVAPAVTGALDGCHVVLSLGAPAALGPASGPGPQPSPGSGVFGAPEQCTQYISGGPPVVLILLGLVLLLAAARLGRGPQSWGPVVALGAFVGIAVAVGWAAVVLGISTSDQQQASPGLVTILAAGTPVFVALASSVVLGRAYTTPGYAAAEQAPRSIKGERATSPLRSALFAAFVVADAYAFVVGGYTTLSWGAPGVGNVGWISNVLIGEALTILPLGYLLCLWGSTLGLGLGAICAGASVVFALVASVELAIGGPHADPIGFAILAVPGLVLGVGVVLVRRAGGASTMVHLDH